MTAREFIKTEESLNLKPYHCTEGFLTIGYGHNMDANPLPDDIARYLKEHGEITLAMAERLFEVKFGEAQLFASKTVRTWNSLNEVRKAVCIAMIFQMGEQGFADFHNTIRYIEAGKFRRAAVNMLQSAWENQTELRAHKTAILMAAGEWLESA